tara:strand:- start:429 stop:2537 length:2109 start_codon:yes stop_codon:yes gene_type:complete
VANYGINIDVKVKTRELTNFNLKIKQTNERINAANKSLERFVTASPKHIPKVSQSFRDLTVMVNKANEAFNKSTLGTPQAVDAARNLVRANDELNIGLQKRTKLLEQITVQMNLQKMAQKGIRPSTMFASPIGPGQATSVFSGRVKQNIAASQAMRQGGFASFSSRADQVTEAAKIEAVKNKARDRHLKNIDKKVAKIATIQTQQQAQKAFAALPGGSFGISGGQIGPRLPLRNRLGFGKNAQGGPFSMPGGAMGRIKGGFGSGLIGGGFPLLFGAGGLSSVMGGVAGAAGGALAPGGGFAASIAATALAAQIEKTIAFRKALNKVNSELENMGISSTFSRKQIKELAKEFEITNEEAIKLAEQFKTFGAEQADVLLSAFGSRETFNALSGLRNSEDVLGKIQSLREQISETTRQDLLQTLATKGSLEAQLKLERVIFDQRKKAFVSEEIKKIKILDVPKEFRQDLENFKEIKKLQLGAEFEATNGSALKLLETEIKINEQLQFISEFQAPTDQLREMLNPMRQILDLSVSIRDGFEESFKGIIKGTMTVQEAFRSMLNRIADHFLDTAAKMAATQLQRSILGLFSDIFSFGNLGNNEMASQGARMAGSRNLGRRADGGPVRRGGSFIVGERGPELFSPGVSGMITPNEMLGGGSTNIVVNVDASGSSVEGDEQQGRELGRVISAAVQSELIQQKRPGGLLA